ncbi:hypothetical protein [Microbacterium lacticum]
MSSNAEDLPLIPAVAMEYVAAGREWFGSRVLELSEELHPLLKSFSKQSVAEFPDVEVTDEVSTDYRQFAPRYEIVLTHDTALGFDVDAVMGAMYEIADGLGRQKEQGMMRFISDSAEASGNVVHMNLDDPVETYIEALKTLEVSFDSNGESNLALVASPELLERLRASPPTREQTRRIDAIMDAKREEHRAARSRRQLP